MITINISISNKRASLPEAIKYVCGNKDYVIKFDFDEEWGSHNSKTARFIFNNRYLDVEFNGDTCPVPVITNTLAFMVGVFVGDNYEGVEDILSTTPVAVPCETSIRCVNVAANPSTGKNYTNEAKGAAVEAKASADSAKKSEAEAKEAAASVANTIDTVNKLEQDVNTHEAELENLKFAAVGNLYTKQSGAFQTVGGDTSEWYSGKSYLPDANIFLPYSVLTSFEIHTPLTANIKEFRLERHYDMPEGYETDVLGVAKIPEEVNNLPYIRCAYDYIGGAERGNVVDFENGKYYIYNASGILTGNEDYYYNASKDIICCSAFDGLDATVILAMCGNIGSYSIKKSGSIIGFTGTADDVDTLKQLIIKEKGFYYNFIGYNEDSWSYEIIKTMNIDIEPPIIEMSSTELPSFEEYNVHAIYEDDTYVGTSWGYISGTLDIYYKS